ncbi:MAG: hypothetical protein K0R94_191 [Burkholderiales bacterium]|jgi:hypothetical protein|nr:hypothetical protein [Burkholderiales bacterium]
MDITRRPFSFRRFIFHLIKSVLTLLRKNHCKIDSIKKDWETTEYAVSFIYTTKRQIFVKSSIEIYNNEFLLDEFLPYEAALIGFYAACAHSEKINKNSNNQYLNSAI